MTVEKKNVKNILESFLFLLQNIFSEGFASSEVTFHFLI